MSNCPCCSSSLIRCVRQKEIYWFCLHCRQEMPDLTAIAAAQKQKELELSSNFASKREANLVNR